MRVTTAYDRRMRSQNLVHLLQNRESGYFRNGAKISRSSALSFERQFLYKSITPRLTIKSIGLPPVYLRKFTPDGTKLLAFTQDQKSLQIFTYRGLGAAASLPSQANVGTSECIIGSALGNKLFDQLFHTKFIVRLCLNDFSRHHLHREFSIFLENGRYVLLVGMCVHNGGLTPSEYVQYPDLFDKLEQFSYIFFVVDLELGKVTDKLCLPQDAICMSHNHGVSLHGQKIAILSRLRQCIYLYEFVDGRLIRQETIGTRPRACTMTDIQISDLNLSTKLTITHIKQRVLSFLYRKIEQNGLQTDEQKCQEYQKFYKNFDFMENMIVEKMQLASSEILFLRYEERPKTTSDVVHIPIPGETLSPRRLYVFYTITDEQVVGVYREDSLELFHILLLFNDMLCNVRSIQTGDVPTSPTYHIVHRNFMNRTKTSVRKRQVALRFNSSFPVSTQSFTVSPFLKYNMLFYDDRYISPLERPKHCATQPIVFRERASSLVKFRLNATAQMPSVILSDPEYCAFIFHPIEPLVISIQKCMRSFASNVHIYNQSTVVNQH